MVKLIHIDKKYFLRILTSILWSQIMKNLKIITLEDQSIECLTNQKWKSRHPFCFEEVKILNKTGKKIVNILYKVFT